MNDASRRHRVEDLRRMEAKAALQGGVIVSAEAADQVGARQRADVDIGDIPVEVVVVLGRTTLPLSRLMAAGQGERFSLDTHFGQPVELQVKGRVIGHGEIFADPEDSAIGIRLLSIATVSG